MTGRPQQQPGAGGSRNSRPSGGSSVDLRASIIIAAARDSSLPGSWPRCSPTAAALCRCWPPAMPAAAATRGGIKEPAPLWRLLRRSPGQQNHPGGSGQQPAGLMAAPFPRRRVPFVCRLCVGRAKHGMAAVQRLQQQEVSSRSWEGEKGVLVRR